MQLHPTISPSQNVNVCFIEQFVAAGFVVDAQVFTVDSQCPKCQMITLALYG